jgi:hypothetical protein
MSEREAWQSFFAGFDLGGYRQTDGTVVSIGGDATVPDWPKEIKVFGNTYTLEHVTPGKNGWENANYV